MKVFMRLSRLMQRMKSASFAATGVAVLAGGMMFAGDANAIVLVSEDFEDAAGFSGWTFAQYGTGANYSASPHSGVPGGGDFYGWNPDGNANGDLADVTSTAPIDLPASDTVINFDGWLASYTSNDDFARFEAEFFDGNGGTGSSLGAMILANGVVFTAADGVTESVDEAGTLVAGDAGANRHNWKHYVTTTPITTGAQSVVIHYHGDLESANNGNDAYADNINITTAVPEPGALSLLGCVAMGLIALFRRSK